MIYNTYEYDLHTHIRWFLNIKKKKEGQERNTEKSLNINITIWSVK
jgi:hypothetical protein